MVSTGGGIAIAVVVLVLAAAVGWIVFTQLRARKLGLPPPSLTSYLPWKKQDNTYGPPRPAPGGVVGWFNDQVRKFKNRNNRSAAGAYEQPTHGGAAPRGRRGLGPLDPDEAWDARVGHEADGYGYYEEQELSGGPADRRGSTGYHGGGGSYSMNLAATPGAEYDEEAARGRAPTRSPGAAAAGQRNPFDDDAAAGDSLRGVSPRPIETTDAHAQARAHQAKEGTDSADSSPTERRSVFREDV
ncbi:acid phosphatase-like protein [Purpureocillium lavendulum]|uniref:Acid phosphatase-like protein n=1 Tax=Purpureocillium lavendulum TaxID=1247861 RepID=A0AB34FYT2_9HYPO|nr:acid phosphatase-like protein [Purpureocillium lavendulum]